MSFFWLMALWTILASGAEPRPVHEIRLSSALRCKFPFHAPVGLQFAPTKDRLAVILQHEPERPGSVAHLVLVSTSGDVLRPPTYVPNLAAQVTERDQVAVPGGPAVPLQPHAFLWWSWDSDYVAFAGARSVIILRADGPARCEVTLEDAGAIPAGFGAENSFLVGHSPLFRRYNSDCTSRGSGEGTAPEPAPFRAQGRTIRPVYDPTILEFSAGVAAIAASRGRNTGMPADSLLGCSVREREGKEILLWWPSKMELVGIPQMARGAVRAVCALSPSADFFAAAAGLRVRVYRLPPN